MTKVFNKFKKPCFWPIFGSFSQFWEQKNLRQLKANRNKMYMKKFYIDVNNIAQLGTPKHTQPILAILDAIFTSNYLYTKMQDIDYFLKQSFTIYSRQNLLLCEITHYETKKEFLFFRKFLLVDKILILGGRLSTR